ncbi:hypothetical protein [Actinotalea fermentans]|uniref:hypothetical protein n=1 Tax=Actinotalea fermentans TaxID=43671 RepID=UPI00051F49CB|nr:hypothetical protein [Actinotalea fermentans]KGM17067.1 hypothetical protein N867_10570 [Actinotalea fermentans ATCC 43279 = JCM 9966 = DSM 3133]
MLTAVAAFLTLGLPGFALRAAALKRPHAVAYALTLNLLSSSGFLIVGGTWAVLSGYVGAKPAIMVALAIACEKNAEARIALGTQFGRARLVNLLISTRGFLALGSALAAIQVGLSVMDWYAYGRAAGAILLGTVLAAAVRDWPLTFRRPRDGSLESMLSLAVASAAAAIRQLDAWIVGVFGGVGAAGVFGAALRMITPFDLLSSAVSVVVMAPSALGDPEGVRRALLRIARWSAAAALVLGAAWPLLLETAPLILGEDYRAAGPALAWLALASPALVALPVTVTAMQGQGLGRRVAGISAVFSAIFLVAIALGTEQAAAAGAAAAYALTTWLRYAGLLVSCAKSWETRKRATLVGQTGEAQFGE